MTISKSSVEICQLLWWLDNSAYEPIWMSVLTCFSGELFISNLWLSNILITPWSFFYFWPSNTLLLPIIIPIVVPTCFKSINCCSGYGLSPTYSFTHTENGGSRWLRVWQMSRHKTVPGLVNTCEHQVSSECHVERSPL